MRPDALDIEKIKRSPDCIYILDTSLTITTWNDASVRKFKISRQAAEGKHLLHLFPQIAGDYQFKCLQQCATEGKSFFFNNMPYLESKGFYFQLVQSLKDGETCVGVLNIVRDVQDDNSRFHKKDLLNPLLRNIMSF